MNNNALPAPRRRHRGSPTLLERTLVIIFSGSALFVILLALLASFFQLRYLSRVYPGVSIAGTDLSGLKREETALKLGQNISYPQTGLIALEENGQTWVYKPEQLGLLLNADASAEEAYKVGRSGWPWRRWYERLTASLQGMPIPPVMVFDGRAAHMALEQIANQINQPTIEASLRIEGQEVVALPGQIGRTLDTDEALRRIEAQVRTFSDGVVQLPMIERPPGIMDVSGQAELARRILNQALTLQIPNASENDHGPWKVEPEALADMLEVVRVKTSGGEQYQLELNPQALRELLEPLEPVLEREPQNPRFVFNDDTGKLEVIQDAVIGRRLMVDESIDLINDEVINGAHDITLVFEFSDPVVTDNTTAEELQIKELVSSQTTYFYGSSAERIQNIETAASQFHGLLVPPGATFSMTSVLGDISLDSGYAEALIIYGDRTIKGVGGGVCQVSTTLFRTAFFGGFPIVERYSHAYRVYYYELSSSGNVNQKMAGLDATVYAPLIDFKFTNDTPYWLLMETYVNPPARTINWKFYSTSDGRTVDWETSGLQNIEDKLTPIYEKDEELEKGEVEQLDWAIEGADVTVSRTVTRNGEILHDDTLKTHYEPWATVCHYGPGTEGYPPAENKQDIDSCKILKKAEKVEPEK